MEYKRLDETVVIEEINNRLAEITKDGWTIKNYKEVPSHIAGQIRMQILLEKEEPKTTKKNRLFS